MQISEERISKKDSIFLDKLLGGLESKTGMKIDKDNSLKKIIIEGDQEEAYLIRLNNGFSIGTGFYGERFYYGNMASKTFKDGIYIIGDFEESSGKKIMGYFEKVDNTYKKRPYNMELYFRTKMGDVKFKPKYVVVAIELPKKRVSNIFSFNNIKLEDINVSDIS